MLGEVRLIGAMEVRSVLLGETLLAIERFYSRARESGPRMDLRKRTKKLGAVRFSFAKINCFFPGAVWSEDVLGLCESVERHIF